MRKIVLFVTLLVTMLMLFTACGECEHTEWSNWTVTTESTCTAEGIETRKCMECGEEETQAIALKAHSYGSWTTVTAATCTSEGTEEQKCSCGDTKTRAISKTSHSYGSWTTVTPATCTSSGTKESKCSVCGDTKTETISATGHSYGPLTSVKSATCTEEGKTERKCNNCGNVETGTTAKLSHKYDSGTIVKNATCTASGSKKVTCTLCGVSTTQTISALGHSLNRESVCTRCGAVSLNMTSSEKTTANQVYWISNRSFDYYEDTKRFVFSFCLKDVNEKELAAPAIVDIRIENDKGEVVYKKTRVVKSSDYGTWSNAYGSKWYKGSVDIYLSDVTPGTIDSGTVYYKVYNPGYFSFDESNSKIYDDLPLKPTTIKMPSLPETVHDYNYSGTINYSCKITGVTYKISDDDLYLYFTGEKIYDSQGTGYSRACTIGWKLYDSEGYIVESGTYYSPGIKTGEKFKNGEDIIWGCITPGENYTLSIENTR